MDDTDQLLPLCFVLMPLGKKMDAAGRVTNFDSVYAKVIAPAVERSGLEPIRADEEKIGGTIHKPMFERLRDRGATRTIWQATAAACSTS
jgi:hypothetical protein